MITDESIPGISSNENIQIPRIIPTDIYDASIKSIEGKNVDITTLIPTGEEGESSFQEDVQNRLDWVSMTVSSIEYVQFTENIEEIMADVRNQHFLFDLEGTLTNDVRNLNNMNERVYYLNPWMHAVVKTLIKNGNHVGFWTSAAAENLADMKRAMSPEMASLPAIGRDGYELVVKAYHARHSNQLTDQQVLNIMQSVYPNATMESFQTGVRIFVEDRLEAFDDNPIYFLRGCKYPQLFIPPDNGFFIDDNSTFIDSAINRGWPKNRAVKCNYDPGQDNATKVAQTIALAIKK